MVNSRRSATPDKVIAVGYARVSTDKQADHGVSLLAQAAKINSMAIVQDATLCELITEGGESAKNMNRPGLQRLLSLVDSGRVQTVIIAKLDRLTRSVRDLADLLERFERRNVALVSVAESLDTGSAAGRLVLNIMVSVSQWEREAIGERTSVALQHKRSTGRVFTRVTPYGYERDGDILRALDDEQAIIHEVKQLRQKGWSLRKIGKALDSKGVPLKNGGAKWHAQVVSDILTNSMHSSAVA